MKIYGYVHAGNKTGTLYRHKGATAPMLVAVEGEKYDYRTEEECLGYWETRYDLFEWACHMMRVDREAAEYEDAFTGELLDMWQLQDEACELEEAV